jgi:hypothetical protein
MKGFLRRLLTGAGMAAALIAGGFFHAELTSGLQAVAANFGDVFVKDGGGGGYKAGVDSSGRVAVDPTQETGTVGAGTAPARMIVGGALYNSTQPTATTGQSVALQVSPRGALYVVPGTETFNVTCASGCTPGSTFADEGAFTQGSTSISAIGGLYTTSVTNLTTGQAGVTRLTNDRKLMVNVADALPAGSNTVGGVTLPNDEAATGAGTAPSKMIVGGALYNSTQPTATTGQSVALQVTSRGELLVSPGTSGFTIAALPAGSNLIGHVNLDSQSGNGSTPYHLAGGTGASTNSTSLVGAAANLTMMTALNTTTTVYYLKLYNSSSAPTCSSATNLKHVFPIPPAAASGGVGGFVVPLPAPGESYSSGIGFCVTASGSDTANDNAATGVYIEASYK